jgi:hypothetical protein
VAGSNTQEATDRLSVLKDEIGRLDEYEKLIDQHKTVSQQFSFFVPMEKGSLVKLDQVKLNIAATND